MNKSVYAMVVYLYRGDEGAARFCFTAQNDEEAKSKAFKWCHYHGFKFGEDVSTRIATPKEIGMCSIRNEYIPTYNY